MDSNAYVLEGWSKTERRYYHPAAATLSPSQADSFAKFGIQEVLPPNLLGSCLHLISPCCVVPPDEKLEEKGWFKKTKQNVRSKVVLR